MVPDLKQVNVNVFKTFYLKEDFYFLFSTINYSCCYLLVILHFDLSLREVDSTVEYAHLPH